MAPLKTLLLASLLALSSLVSSSAIPKAADAIEDDLVRRAGGPIAKPLPSNCQISNVSPTFTPSSTAFQPKLLANASALLYYYFVAPGSPFNQTTCMQECYGYGDGTQCKSVFMANAGLTPVGYFGTPGGAVQDACLMFRRRLIANDFEPAKVQGTYQNAVARNIMCPPPASTTSTSTTSSVTATPITTTLLTPTPTSAPGGTSTTAISTPIASPTACPPLVF